MKKTDIRFAERLKELREAAGLSMAELARAVGVSDASICKWENGDAEPKISYVAKLEAFFDCSLEYLIGNETAAADDATKPDRVCQVAVSADEKNFLGGYKKLSPDKKAILAETLNVWTRTDGDDGAE